MMDEKRRGEIARAYLKDLLKREGFKVDNSFRRSAGNAATRTGIPFAELLEFVATVAGEILAEVSDLNKPATQEETEGFNSSH